MTNIPVWYYKIRAAYRLYNEYKNIKKLYEKMISIPHLNIEQELFNSIKKNYEMYWKNLKAMLKEKQIYLLYPVDIIIRAQELGIINDAEDWLVYIKKLNELSLSENRQEQHELYSQIILDYKDKIHNIYSTYERILAEVKYKEPKQKFKYPKKNKKPSYSPDDLQITEHSYNLFLNFAKENKDIKYMWLYGSRAKGCYRKNSDIDILVDSPLSTFEKLEKLVKVIRCPYRFDLVNIYDSSDSEFINLIIKDAKIIYRAEDFNK